MGLIDMCASTADSKEPKTLGSWLNFIFISLQLTTCLQTLQILRRTLVGAVLGVAVKKGLRNFFTCANLKGSVLKPEAYFVRGGYIHIIVNNCE